MLFFHYLCRTFAIVSKLDMTYKLLRICLMLMSHIPFFMLYVLADIVYFLMYYVIRYRRKVVRRNLTESFPEKSPAEIKDIERKFYHFFADNMLESLKLSAMSADEMGKRMKFTNVEEVNKVLRSGQSVGLYLGHYANWEWISSMPLHLEKSAVAAQIYHKLHNKDMDRLTFEHRASHGAVNVEMHSTARYISGLAAENKVSIIGFIADQSPRFIELNYFLPFLNHDTPVLTGTEKIIKHFHFDPWFVKTTKVKRGYYEVEFVKMDADPKARFGLTDLYFRMLEEMIRERPELYLWSHNRFKHARRGNESAYPTNTQTDGD